MGVRNESPPISINLNGGTHEVDLWLNSDGKMVLESLRSEESLVQKS